MFGRKRKADAGELIYADTRPAEVSTPTAAKRKNRVTTVIFGMVLVALAVMAVMTLHFRFQEMQERYALAQTLLGDRKYAAAAAEFRALGNFRDSQAQAAQLEDRQTAYDAAAALVDQQRYDEAIAAFRALGDYADSPEWAARRVTYQKALDLINEIDVGQTRLLTRILTDQVRLTDENSYPTTVGYEVAAALLASLGDYRSAPALMDRCYYSAGLVKLGWKDWDGALAYMEKMKPETAAEFCQEYEQRYREYTEEEGQ